MKKTLRDKLDTTASKYARAEAAEDAKVKEAYIAGAKWWNLNSRKELKDYEKKIKKALKDRNGKVNSWEELQIEKTARLWLMRDRVADELDMERSFIRMGTGSTKQPTENLDPRLALLEKFDRTLTADLTAIGLNYNTTPTKVRESTRKEEDEMANYPLSEYFRNNKQ